MTFGGSLARNARLADSKRDSKPRALRICTALVESACAWRRATGERDTGVFQSHVFLTFFPFYCIQFRDRS